MPWKVSDRMSERMKFVTALEQGLTMTEVCLRFGVSRKTGYKWVRRFEDEGASGLLDRSRARKHQSHQTPEWVVQAILDYRRQHPTFGPKKLIRNLRGKCPNVAWPALSTCALILSRHGLSRPMVRQRALKQAREPFSETSNGVWAADYKGHFRLGNKRVCYPLTMMDEGSRFILACEGLESPSLAPTRAVFERVFRTYGLPDKIRTDNGSPFVISRAGGLSQLGVWWIKLGIQPVRITPGRPQENGRLERMHRVLKEETTRPPAEDHNSQQARFNEFIETYNRVRPHEGIGNNQPNSRYAPSSRAYPKVLSDPDYPGHYELRRVPSNGMVRLKGRRFYVSDTLSGELVGAEEVKEGHWKLMFGFWPLGILDLRKSQFETIGCTGKPVRAYRYNRKL